MEPVSAILGVIGLGMQIFGGFGASENAKQMSQVSQDEAAQEQAINDQKQKAMELDARRQQLEQIRQAQKLQALGLDRATNQGAQFGSGLQGGLAEVQDQSATNLNGIFSGLTIGREINARNKAISADKMQMAALGGQAATDQGIMSLGGALMKAGPITGQLSKGFSPGGSNTSFNPFNTTGSLY